MKETPDFKLGQIVWYMDGLWAHVGTISRKRITHYDTLLSPSEQTDYEINNKWIPSYWLFATKAALKETLIHYIDNNSPQELSNFDNLK